MYQTKNLILIYDYTMKKTNDYTMLHISIYLSKCIYLFVLID